MSFRLKKKDINFLKGLVKRAGRKAYSLQKKELHVEIKKDNTLVTNADTLVQEYLIRKISRRFPGALFIHEENFSGFSSTLKSDTITVVIDPIDGTAMYSMRLPFWCVSVGIFEGYRPRYGFIYAPAMDWLFYNDDENSYLNDAVKQVERPRPVDSESNIFYSSEIYRDYSIEYPGKVRNLGSTALHASLMIDSERNRTIVFAGKSYLWDWAGAFPILEMAGLHLRYLNGGPVNFKEFFSADCSIPDYLLVYNADSFNAVQDYFVPR